MAYKLTPYDRRRQAALLYEQRRAGKTATSTAKKATTATKKDTPSTMARIGATAGDIGANVLTGLGKGLEGINDFTAGIVGAVGGIFSDKFRDDVQDFIAKDFTSDWYGDALQEATHNSYLNGNKAGQITEGIAQGVGQLLPAVAAAYFTGGASLVPTLVTMTSAAGTATEEAFNDGAGYGEGMAYGFVSGGIEGATERLVGGATGKVLGKGVLDKALGGVAKTGVARVAKDAVGEGVEEMISELAAPAAKSIYKGRDAFAEYGDADYWKGVGEAGIIGAGTSIAYGGTVGHITKTSGIYADVSSVTDHIAELEKQRSRTDLSQAQRVQIERTIKADQEELANRLGKLSVDKRKRVYERVPHLSLQFNEDGSIRAENLAALDANIAAAADTTYDVRFRSATLSADTITRVLANGSKDGAEIKAYRGTLDEDGQAALADVAEMSGAVIERSGRRMGQYVVAENIPGGNSYFDVDSGVFVIAAEELKSGKAATSYARDIIADTYVGDAIHEWAHGIEGTTYGDALDTHLKQNEGGALYALAIEDVLARGYMQDYFPGESVESITQKIQEIVAKQAAGETLTDVEQRAYTTFKSETFAYAAQRLLGNKSFVKKLITTEPTMAERVIAKIRDLGAKLKNLKSKDAQNAAKYLRTAENLYLLAIEEVGGTIDSKGKIHLTNRDDEDAEATEIGDVVLDGAGEVRYNKGGTYVQWKSDAMAWANKHDTEIGDRAFGSDGVHYYFYEAIDPYGKGRASDYKVLFSVSASNEALVKRLCEEAVKNNGRNLESIYSDIGRYRNIPKNHRSNNGDVDGKVGSYGRPGGLDRGKPASVGKRGSQKSDRPVHFHFDDDGTEHVTYASGRTEIKRSRKTTGDVVTLSKGALAKLMANYHGDKVFTKKAVIAAMSKVEGFMKLPAKVRNKFIDDLWRGYNEHLNEQGFERFSNLMWDKLHAAVLEHVEMNIGQLNTLDEEIEAALDEIVASGTPSVKARLESDTSTEGYRRRAEYWRREHEQAAATHKLMNDLKYEVERLAQMKKGAFVNAAHYRGNTFDVAINELARINWRGGLVSATNIRKHFAALDAWYSKENPLYGGDDGPNARFRLDISEALHDLGNSQNGALSVGELASAIEVVKYFKNEIETHGTIWKDGKRQSALPEARDSLDKAMLAKKLSLRCGIWQRLSQSRFARLVSDPAMLMRQADAYLDGFFTKQYEELRQGTIDASVKERELSGEFEAFWDEHKAYSKRYNTATVTYEGKEIPLQEGIQLYMTMLREHAFAGLAGAGFEIDGKKKTERISEGFALEVQRQIDAEYKALSPEELLTLTKKQRARIEQMGLEKAVEARRKALFEQFTAEDKALIAVMERGYEQCRAIKERIDTILHGDSNVTTGYYVPIRRAGLTELVDAFTGFEGDRVSNLSMNRETVKNAHRLYIEPAHIVYMRHLKATSLYHGLGIFTDNFNRLYNLNVAEAERAEKERAAEMAARIDLSRDSELATRIKDMHGARRYKTIAAYIREMLGDGDIELSDGKIAIVDNSDALHMANKAADKKAAQISRIKEMVQRAILYAQDTSPVHDKFDLFYYYQVEVTFDGDTFPIYLNVGRAKNDGKLHIYDITNKIRDTADRINGLERPVGNALTNGIPIDSIPQNGDGVNPAEMEISHRGPQTVRDAIGQSSKFMKGMVTYFKALKQDVEGISKKSADEAWYDDAVGYIRSAYATYQLGFNPKVWVTQLSSLIAGTNIVDMDCLIKGLTVSGKDVDEYCRLAWLRNNDNEAALAQAVSAPQNAVQRAGRNALQKVRDVAMLPIGKVDRFVIKRLFGACQLQVEKNGGAKVGTKENKIEAGKMLQRLILETQQNSLATERSAAMRSANDLLKAATMFSADAMKVGARFVDAFGELSVLRTRLREAKKAGNAAEIKMLEREVKRAKKQCVRATVALVSVSFFNALLAYAFKWLYRRDDEESLGTLLADTFGNMLGGIPIVRDVWGFLQDGFEVDNFLFSTMNDVLGTAVDSFQLIRDAAEGKEITRQQALGNMRKVLYAVGQLAGVPVRNIYNVTTGLINRVAPAAGYQVESLFLKKPFSSDLAKAIEADDERMIGVISGLMLDEKVGIEDDKTRTVLRDLTGKGYAVLPRAVGDTVTLDGEERTLTGKQQKRFRTVYGVAEDAIADMVRLKRFAEQDDAVKEKAIRFIYDVYWNLALEDVMGENLAEKNVLFAEAIDIEKLAIIIAMARSIEADKDKNGKAIAGTKKRKVEQLVSSLHLTAAQKYMVMGYLGYTNANGREQVERYIGGLKLTKGEKKALLKYSGYAA